MGAGQRTTHDIPIGVRTLDDILAEHGIPQVNLLRLNLGGAEVPFLQGAEKTLSAQRGLRLVVDLHPQRGTDVAAVCGLLEQYDFTLYDIRDPGQRPLKIAPDLRCLAAQK